MARFDDDLSGRTVVVTGGSRGLGIRIAGAFVDAGASVVIAARDRNALTAAALQLGREVVPVAGDIADREFCEHLVSVAVERFGGLDTFVANAAVSPSYTLAKGIDDATWRSVLDVNVTGTFLCVQAAAAAMQRGGSIIVTSSVLGQRPRRRLSAYSVSKAALDGLVKALALDYADDGIRVNAIAPGWFDSDLTLSWQAKPELAAQILDHTTMGRWGDIDELVGSYLFLASPASSFMTGTTLAVDGGYLLR